MLIVSLIVSLTTEYKRVVRLIVMLGVVLVTRNVVLRIGLSQYSSDRQSPCDKVLAFIRTGSDTRKLASA